MASLILSPGNVRVVSMVLLHPYRGAWVAELELDIADPSLAPAAGTRVTITISPPGGSPATLLGTVDPRGSGPFVQFYYLRVVGGGAGWDQPVPAQAFDSDGGVTDVRVYGTTATAVGESISVQTPTILGNHFERSAGPASRVLEGVQWWVDPASGVTFVGTRAPATPDATLVLLSWDPLRESATIVCDTLVLPGTVVTDERIPNGPITVRDVEQRFDASGSHVTAWCGTSPVTQLANDLRSMVLEFSGVKYCSAKLYRVTQQGSDGRLQLQAVHPAEGFPDTLPITIYGPPGFSAKVVPGSICLVEFLYGDPTQPVVRDFAPTTPLESTVDASAIVHVGPSAARVQLAGGTLPVIPSPWGGGIVAALGALATSLSAYAPLAPAGAALTTALAALPPGATVKTVAA
jgi:hypothetical protein